ncbi:MAG: PLP-dependent aminotransferase family protein [Negativicutes bacterium]|nr:PLP-dependent aminotransferase family protein [Negativicutes bacterium]
MEYVFSKRISSLQPSAIREILKATADPKIIPFAAGNPAPEAFPVQAIVRFTEEIYAENPIAALQYSVSEGYPALRQTLTHYLRQTYQIGRDFDAINIVSGAQQVMDFAAKVLCNEGDTVICEDPSFIGSLNTFRSYDLNLVGLPMEEDGIRPEELEAALISNPRTKLIYLIPNFQNPTGRTMSLAKRKAVYALAVKYNVMILEDNPYGELRFSGESVAAIKSFDEEGVVIYAGTFSKVIAPGIRVGYVCAPAPITAKMTIAKQASDVHTNILAQMVCDRMLTRYDFPAHLEKLRTIYRRKADLMLAQLDQWMPSMAHTVPQGGLFVWCELPAGVDVADFTKEALRNQVAVVPGRNFLTDPSQPTQALRLNYSTPTDEQIIRGIQILARILTEWK